MIFCQLKETGKGPTFFLYTYIYVLKFKPRQLFTFVFYMIYFADVNSSKKKSKYKNQCGKVFLYLKRQIILLQIGGTRQTVTVRDGHKKTLVLEKCDFRKKKKEKIRTYCIYFKTVL